MNNINIEEICKTITSVADTADFFAVTVDVSSKNFNNSEEALSEFLSLDGKGWLCETGQSSVWEFTSSSEVKSRISGWVLEGEQVSADGSESIQIGRNNHGGWQVTRIRAKSNEEDSNSVYRVVSLRRRGGGHLLYHVGYMEAGGRLEPAWQRFVGFNDKQEDYV